jgi:excisionase family DNA binding protein
VFNTRVERYCMSESVLTLQEAADELGVHYMTAYRYVRLGLMDADKIGGTWKVTPDAVAAFQAGSVRSPVAPGERAPWSERLESRLVAGDSRGAWGVIESAMSAGKELDQVYLKMLTPAMVSIGERWVQASSTLPSSTVRVAWRCGSSVSSGLGLHVADDPAAR